ncbi:MAG: prolyl oligopeptidase family serine peptidase [Gammaproteobacteria bacterium]
MKKTYVLLLVILFQFCGAIQAQNTQLEKNFVYGHLDGMAMVYDVEIPEDSNGLGIVFIVSGGWHSAQENFEVTKPFWKILLTEGYTLFHLYHPSMPTYKVPDAYEGVKAGLAHIYENAQAFGADPDRLGITGVSSGGHLALLLAMDVDEEQAVTSSRRLEAVVAFMPPIDLRGVVGNARATPALDFDPALAPALSPVDHVSADDPPVLLVHGANDTVAVYSDSVRLQSSLESVGATARLVTIEGGHEIYPEPEMTKAHEAMLEWFKSHL